MLCNRIVMLWCHRVSFLKQSKRETNACLQFLFLFTNLKNTFPVKLNRNFITIN